MTISASEWPEIATSRCFRCFSRKLSAGDLSCLAEILGVRVTRSQNNSETARYFCCFLLFFSSRNSWPASATLYAGRRSTEHDEILIKNISCQLFYSTLSRVSTEADHA